MKIDGLRRVSAPQPKKFLTFDHLKSFSRQFFVSNFLTCGRGNTAPLQHQTFAFLKNFREMTNMETTSNERMAKSELNAAEKMNMASIKRIKAVLETLNEGHKLDEVRASAIYYSDSAILYNKINAILHINS